MKIWTIMFLALVTWGCVENESVDLDANESFLSQSGKSDTFQISEGSTKSAGILALANASSQKELDDDIGLDKRAAENIIEFRTNTGHFETLKELDGIKYVGKSAFRRLHDFAKENGYFREVHGISQYSALGKQIIHIVNHADKTTLSKDIALQERVPDSILEYRKTKTIDSLELLHEVITKYNRSGHSASDAVAEQTFEKLSIYAQKPLENVDEILTNIADTLGVSFNYESSKYASMIENLSFEELPRSFRTSAEEATFEHLHSSYWEVGFSNAYSITEKGKIVGYIVVVDYWIDNHMSDEGRDFVYVNLKQDIVAIKTF